MKEGRRKLEEAARKYGDGELCHYEKFLRKHLFFWALKYLLARFTLVCYKWIVY